jgi:sugar/nucleoside kinase (ribokinase family)
MAAPDFLVVGHLVQDKVVVGYRLGGTAAYASLTAHRLGLRTAVLTRAAADLDLSSLPREIEVHRLPSSQTTVFENIYSGGHRPGGRALRGSPSARTQYVWAKAESIAAADVPAELASARIVLLGPVVGEVEDEVARRFSGSLVGICAQGWLRTVAADGRVGQLSPRQWRPSASGGFQAVFVSEEDLPPAETEETLAGWAAQAPLIFFTLGYRGSRLWWDGRWQEVPGFPAREVDPTGSGDVFAAAFLARYLETDDVAQAALFAAAAAAVSVEAVGTAGVPTRAQVEERLRCQDEGKEEP